MFNFSTETETALFTTSFELLLLPTTNFENFETISEIQISEEIQTTPESQMTNFEFTTNATFETTDITSFTAPETTTTPKSCCENFKMSSLLLLLTFLFIC